MSSQESHQATILVVDDVESQRDITCRMLDTLGYQTRVASSGEEAVAYLKNNTVDLLLLDMIMDPGINGRETYEQVTRVPGSFDRCMRGIHLLMERTHLQQPHQRGLETSALLQANSRGLRAQGTVRVGARLELQRDHEPESAEGGPDRSVPEQSDPDVAVGGQVGSDLGRAQGDHPVAQSPQRPHDRDRGSGWCRCRCG